MKAHLPILLLSILFATAAVAQTGTRKPAAPEARLVNSYQRATSELKSLFFDHFFSELAGDPTAVGYVYLYCGKTCMYGEIEAHMRGLALKIMFKRFPEERIVVINGGFREKQSTELWLVPAGACVPPPTPTLNINSIRFRGTRRTPIPYDCC